MSLLKIRKMKIERPDLLIDEFEISSGEVIRLKGPSGSGKSSFLKALVSLKKFEAQEFSFHPDNKVQNSIREQILYLPQFGLTSNLVVKDLVFKILKDKFNLEKLNESFKAFSLENILNASIDNLSGGERQILSLIMANELDRSVILCDESFSAIDEQRMELVNKMLLAWKQKCKTIVYISHHKLQLDEVTDHEYTVSTHGNYSEIKKC